VVLLRAKKRSRHTLTGRTVKLRVGRKVRRLRASYVVGGRRHHATVALERRR
jgi:hypothetical protein